MMGRSSTAAPAERLLSRFPHNGTLTPVGRVLSLCPPACPARVANLTVATLSSVGFGLSPAAGRAIRDLVLTGACSFADLTTFRLYRFAALETDWRAQQGWLPVGLLPAV